MHQQVSLYDIKPYMGGKRKTVSITTLLMVRKKKASATMLYIGRNREGVSASTPDMVEKRESFGNTWAGRAVQQACPTWAGKRKRLASLPCVAEKVQFQSNMCQTISH